MAADEMTAQAVRDVARLERRVAELEAALKLNADALHTALTGGKVRALDAAKALEAAGAALARGVNGAPAAEPTPPPGMEPNYCNAERCTCRMGFGYVACDQQPKWKPTRGVKACRWPDCGCHAPQGPGECRARANGVEGRKP